MQVRAPAYRHQPALELSIEVALHLLLVVYCWLPYLDIAEVPLAK